MPRASSSFIALSSAALSGMLALGCSSSPSSGRTTTDAGHQSDATSRVDASVRSDAGIVTVDAGGAIQYTVDAYVPVYDAGCGSASVVFPGGCGDPASDPHNCGSCGHDCDGGACFDGSCGALPEGVLATGQYMPTALFVDGENAYWRNEGFNIGHGKAPRVLGGQVMRCALAGCGNRPTPIGGADDSWLPRSVALDDDAVYWTNGESVVSCPKTGCGCAPQAVLTFDAPMEIAVHGSTVFFTDLSLTNVGSCPVTGCGTTPTILATRPVGPDGIVTDDASVYWTTGGWGVLTCGLGGCDGGPDTLWFPEFGETNTTGITVDATNVYWTNPIGSSPGSAGEATAV